MNDPNTKYAFQKANANETEMSDRNEPLLFFNYNEYLIADYKSNQSTSIGKLIVVNHFPNNHAPKDSAIYYSTRIVRIPRIYDTIKLSDIIPQFSNYVPGTEPAALSNDINGFESVGTFDDNVFGLTSLTPLVPDLMSAEEFITIINKINGLLYEAFNPYNVFNVVDNLLDLVTANLYNKIFNNFVLENYSKRKLYELENYVDQEINGKLFKDRPLKIISPRRSGYLSLDIQIPKPTS